MSVTNGIQLVVTDLDGTLWDGTGRAHPRTLHALRTLEQASIPVLVATGRRAASAWPLMEANGIGLPSVLLDGALGREFGSDRAFHSRPFSQEVACEVLALLEKLGVSPCINVDTPGRDVVLGERPSVRPEHIRGLESSAREEDPWTAVRSLGVLAFTVLSGDTSAMRELAADVVAQAPVTAAIASDRTYGGVHLSFVALGVSKWDGALGFCAARGLDPNRVLAIGDADNDLEMLENAAIALAVADASPAALERADRVVALASEGGWAEILDLLRLAGD